MGRISLRSVLALQTGDFTRKTGKEAMIRMPSAERCMNVHVNGITVGTDTQRMNIQCFWWQNHRSFPPPSSGFPPSPRLCVLKGSFLRSSQTWPCVSFTQIGLYIKQTNKKFSHRICQNFKNFSFSQTPSLHMYNLYPQLWFNLWKQEPNQSMNINLSKSFPGIPLK